MDARTMPVEISDAPRVSPTPGFAGVTVMVPLSEEPTRAWLDQLALQELPGKGHRVGGASIEFHLDRNLTDVQAIMDRLADAIARANVACAERDREAEKAQTARDARHKAQFERVDRGLEKWWTERAPKTITAARPAEPGPASPS
jgi:hypothetical protein